MLTGASALRDGVLEEGVGPMMLVKMSVGRGGCRDGYLLQGDLFEGFLVLCGGDAVGFPRGQAGACRRVLGEVFALSLSRACFLGGGWVLSSCFLRFSICKVRRW